MYPFRLILLLGILLASFTVHASGAPAKAGPSPNYVSLEPAFIVNVNDGMSVKHMQVKAQLKLTNPELAAEIEKHKPAIQHEMVMLLSGKPVSELRTIQGKEALRTEAVAALQKLMTENSGEPVVEAVYFTEFIIQ